MKIHVWCVGDPSVGISGANATVEIEGWDMTEFREEVKKSLTTCFGEIWDEKPHVVFEDELNSHEEEEI